MPRCWLRIWPSVAIATRRSLYMTEYPGYVVFVGFHAGRIIEEATTYVYDCTWEASVRSFPQSKASAEVGETSAKTAA